MQKHVIASSNVTNIKVRDSPISNKKGKTVMEYEEMKENSSNIILSSNRVYRIEDMEPGTSLTCYKLLEENNADDFF